MNGFEKFDLRQDVTEATRLESALRSRRWRCWGANRARHAVFGAARVLARCPNCEAPKSKFMAS